MFPGWLRRFISSPRQTPVQVDRGTKARRDTVLGLEQLEERSLLSIGGLDLTFGTNGVVTTGFPTAATAVGTVVQTDGKIVVAGTLGSGVADGSPTQSVILARYNANGTPDTTFGTNGVVKTNFGLNQNFSAAAVGLQSNGQIIVTGTDFISSGDSDTFVARFNATDGSLDTSFNSQGVDPGLVHFNIANLADSITGADAPDALYIQQNNNDILVAGETTETQSFSTTKFAVACLTRPLANSTPGSTATGSKRSPLAAGTFPPRAGLENNRAERLSFRGRPLTLCHRAKPVSLATTSRSFVCCPGVDSITASV